MDKPIDPNTGCNEIDFEIVSLLLPQYYVMELDVVSTLNRKIVDFRKLGVDDLTVLGKYNYTKTEKQLLEHRHDQMLEICYCDKGSQFFEVGNQQFLVKGGEVFLHYPGEMHGSGNHPESKGVLYWLIIDLNDDSTNNLVWLCNNLIAKKTRHFKASGKIKKDLEDLFSAYDSNENIELKSIRLHAIAANLLLSLLDSVDLVSEGFDRQRMKAVIDYIDDNLTENITVTELARQINLSESRFKGLFKELSGFTPADYIQREKVRAALRLLEENPHMPFRELAYQFNFSSPQHFSTVIKKYTGQSPSAFKTGALKNKSGLFFHAINLLSLLSL